MQPTARAPRPGLLVLPALVVGTLALFANAVPDDSKGIGDDPHEGRFVYLQSGSPVILQASPLYSAALVESAIRQMGALTPPDGLELDPRGNRSDLIERGLTLFRVPNVVAPRGLDVPPPPDAWKVTLGSGLPAQPVFEHGAALRIPTNEVIIALETATTLEDAKLVLRDVWEELAVRELREFRPGTFLCVLRGASAGRAFEASRTIAKVGGVRWAEPSFINVHLETPGEAPDDRVQFSRLSSLTHQQLLEAKFVTIKLNTVHPITEGEIWQVAVDGHFEDDIDRWIVARNEGSNRALPVVVRERKHGGKRSVYMSGKGLAANSPPDPYLEGISSYLIGETFNLSAHPEVYVEAWFWADFEDPVDAPRQVHDFGRLLLFDVTSQKYVYEHPIAPVGKSGNLTQDTRTDDGWRKLMFRVPAELLASPLQLHVHFYSDDLEGAGGMFVDDIRVLYKAGDAGGDPFCHDPAAQEQYAILPRRQIAGWPTPEDPRVDATAGWLDGFPKVDVIVALLDDGVERSHPDLAFWEPDKNDVDGTEDRAELFPGEPVEPEDRHGTACAGVLGAIANNGIGIAGVAPGALLLPLQRGLDDVTIVRAIDAAVTHGAQILVIPWGWTGAAPRAITQAITDAIDAGTTVVAAAGDGVHRPYSHAVDYPCMLSTSTALICVGASSIAGEPKGPASEDGLYWWSSAEDSTGPDLLAPGTWLHATDRRGQLGYNDGSQEVLPDWTNEFAGTGASACYAGGVAALMLSHDPLLSPEELKQRITATAEELPSNPGDRKPAFLVAPEAAARAAIESAEARDKEEPTETP